MNDVGITDFIAWPSEFIADEYGLPEFYISVDTNGWYLT